MTTSINVKAFKRALSEGSKAVNKKATLPILSTVLVYADSGIVMIASTDLENRVISEPVPAEVGAPLHTCAPPRALADWVATCNPKSTLTLEHDPRTQVLTVKNERSTAHFKCIDADEFAALWKSS